jgi:hypothetical protein
VELPSSIYGIHGEASISSRIFGFAGSAMVCEVCGSTPILRDQHLEMKGLVADSS